MKIDFFQDYTMTIDGAPAKSNTTFEAFNPATEEVIAKVPDASRAQLEAAVPSAKRAFPVWSANPLAERQALVCKIVDAIEPPADDFNGLLTLDQANVRKGT